MNLYMIAGLIVLLVVGVYALRKRHQSTVAVSSSIAEVLRAHVATVEANARSIVKTGIADMKDHTDAAFKVLRADIAKASAPTRIAADGTQAPPYAMPTPTPPAVRAESSAPVPIMAVAPPPTTVAPAVPAAVQVPGASGTGVEVVNDGQQVTMTVSAPYTPNPESNTPDWRKWTDTSPEGYAVFYALEPDGKGGSTVALDPAGHPISSLKYDGHTFPTAAAITAYKEGVAASAVAAAARDAAAAAQVFTGPVPVASLDDEDKKFLWWRMRQPVALTGMAWVEKTLAGTSLELRNAANWVDTGPGAGVMQTFNHETYAGKLRPYA